MNDPEPVRLRHVTFPDLVRLHFVWRKAMTTGSTAGDEERRQLDDEYHDALARFEDEHGEVLSAYWCSEVESAVALTAGKPTTGWLRRLLSVSPKFHRVSDWATKDEPEIAHALHECDALAVRAGEVLRGRSRRICIQLVMGSACHLLSLVDAVGQGRDPALHKAAIAAEQRELEHLRRDYRGWANGDAQLVYFAGMALGIAMLAILYLSGNNILHAEGIEERTIIGSLVAGALGAVVSVIARVNSGTFALDADVARGYTLFLGALRPVIGSVFGLLSYFMLTSKFVQVFSVPEVGTTERFYFLCVIAFAAGFSERWAQDTLTGGLTGQGRTAGAAPPSRRGPVRPAPPEGDDVVS